MKTKLYNLVKTINSLILLSILSNTVVIFSSNAEKALTISKKIKPVPFFTNRTSELDELSKKLELYKKVSLVGVISTGKTEIARKYAELYKKNYELIWFFDSSVDLNEQFVLLARKINNTASLLGDKKISEDIQDAKKETMRFLENRSKWLLVFDNLRISNNDVLEDIINWSNNGHIIISSQDAKGLENKIEVHAMDTENSVKLLKKLLEIGDKQEDRELLKQLVKIFKGYPGPIVNGAFLLKNNKYLSLEEYKNILSKSSDPIKKHMELVFNTITEKDKELLISISVLNNQYFSKESLKIIFDNKINVGESIYNLSRFALLKQTGKSKNNYFFEMHDIVRDSIFKLLTEDQIREELTKVIKKINQSIPIGVINRHNFIVNDPSLKSNLEVLLSNAEKYKVDINIIMELRKNLIDYYLSNLDYYNIENMKKWLEDKEKSKVISLENMDNKEKANYAWYLMVIGIYEDFAKSSFISALKYFNNAKFITDSIKGEPELKAMILLQSAQTQAYGGDIINAQQNMDEVDKILANYKKADFDMGLYWYIKAKLLLIQGKYNEALAAIDNNIKAEAHLPQDIFTAPTYILQSEILNYKGDFKKSYEIIKNIEDQGKKSGYDDHEVIGRILTQLSRAELGKGLINEALSNATEACVVLKKESEKYNNSDNINVDYAAALVAKADATYLNKQPEVALKLYNEAEAIYFNRYGKEYRHMDDVAYLLSQATKVSCDTRSSFWKKHFYNQLIMHFRLEHPKVIDAVEHCKKLGF